MLALELLQPHNLLSAFKMGLGLFGQGQMVLCVCLSG
jgi:hypothetical protein